MLKIYSEYASKILKGEPGYTLDKARARFGSKFSEFYLVYLEMEQYVKLKQKLETSRDIMSYAAFLRELDRLINNFNALLDKLYEEKKFLTIERYHYEETGQYAKDGIHKLRRKVADILPQDMVKRRNNAINMLAELFKNKYGLTTDAYSTYKKLGAQTMSIMKKLNLDVESALQDADAVIEYLKR